MAKYASTDINEIRSQMGNELPKFMQRQTAEKLRQFDKDSRQGFRYPTDMKSSAGHPTADTLCKYLVLDPESTEEEEWWYLEGEECQQAVASRSYYRLSRNQHKRIAAVLEAYGK